MLLWNIVLYLTMSKVLCVGCCSYSKWLARLGSALERQCFYKQLWLIRSVRCFLYMYTRDVNRLQTRIIYVISGTDSQFFISWTLRQNKHTIHSTWTYSKHIVKHSRSIALVLRKSLNNRYRVIKGIDRSFELRGEIRLIQSVMINWRLGNFFYLILNGLHHKISKKPIVAA